MKLLERIAQDPAYYALRVVALIVLFFIIAAIAYAQEVPVAEFSCKDGVCLIQEEQADRLIKMFYWLQQKVLELQAKTGCT